MIEAFRYNKWANLHVLAVCADLSAEQLNFSAPGTYGSVADTLLHVFGAEQRYIRRLTGAEPRISEKDQFPGIAALIEVARQNGDELIRLAGQTRPEDQLDTSYGEQRYRMDSGVVLLQAVHHGNDHRTHICTILGAHGIECGDMDVWAYGKASGAMVPLGAS
jgi:uncharacterized damage-inducible protein DinB